MQYKTIISWNKNLEGEEFKDVDLPKQKQMFFLLANIWAKSNNRKELIKIRVISWLPQDGWSWLWWGPISLKLQNVFHLIFYGVGISVFSECSQFLVIGHKCIFRESQLRGNSEYLTFYIQHFSLDTFMVGIL